MRDYLVNTRVDTIIRNTRPGFELACFNLRRPGDQSGQIFSITEKRMPSVVGDGVSTLEKLILESSRAVLWRASF